jgi:hypothetical protein
LHLLDIAVVAVQEVLRNAGGLVNGKQGLGMHQPELEERIPYVALQTPLARSLPKANNAKANLLEIFPVDRAQLIHHFWEATVLSQGNKDVLKQALAAAARYNTSSGKLEGLGVVPQDVRQLRVRIRRCYEETSP